VVHIHIHVMALFSSEDDASENRTNPLWKVLQKSFVSYKKLQFSKRMYAMKNSIFSRRIHDESNRGVRNTVVMILGERMTAFDRLISRVDAFFFSSYVSEFPPIESKKMFLFTNNTNTTTNTKETTTMKMKSIDFVANQVGGYTTDCGWGCTLRSAQMLFGEALMRSARARRFRRRSLRRSEEDVSEEEEEGEEFKRKKEIVDMFSDDNDDDENEDKKEKKKKKKTKNVFGLRRVYEGDEDENALCPGQWMAPSEICKRYGKMMNRLDSFQNVRCLILGDGCGGTFCILSAYFIKNMYIYRFIQINYTLSRARLPLLFRFCFNYYSLASIYIVSWARYFCLRGDWRALLRGLSRRGWVFFIGDFLFFFSGGDDDDGGCRCSSFLPVSSCSLPLLSPVALMIFAGAAALSMMLSMSVFPPPSSSGSPTTPPSLSAGIGFSSTLPSKSSSETSVASPSPSRMLKVSRMSAVSPEIAEVVRGGEGGGLYRPRRRPAPIVPPSSMVVGKRTVFVFFFCEELVKMADPEML
jgi:hypothetical protein